MPKPTHRLDLVLVPADPDSQRLDALQALYDTLVQRNVINADGSPGDRAGWLLDGFARIRLDTPGRVVLYANQLGGFRVACPDTGANLVPGFNQAMSAWRAGSARSLDCECGATHALEHLDFQPPAAFGSAALVVADVQSRSTSQAFRDLTEQLVGPTVSIWKRP